MAKRGARAEPMPDEALGLVAERFRALADPSRLRILNTLMQGELTVSELVERTALGQANVSRHLGVLRRGGIVGRRAEGNQAFYRITDDTIYELCELVCGGLAEQLGDRLDALGGGRSRRP